MRANTVGKVSLLAAAAAGLALAGCNAPAPKGEGAAAPPAQGRAETTTAEGAPVAADRGWMAQYVELRVRAANARLGNEGPNTGGAEIVGGVPVTAQDNPFQVGLLQKGVTNNFSAQFCGGTLIAPNVVVTAAHCSDFTTAGQVQVLVGARALDGTGTRVNVTSIVIHPKWDANKNDYDVAVWRLAAPAAGPFAKLGTADGTTTLMATGWGRTTEGGPRSMQLLKVGVPLASRTDCNDANSYNGKITERMLCAGKPGGGKDTCQGDSGGPLTRGNELIGVTSWGIGCARPNFFGIYARLSNPEIRSFIEAND